MWTIPKNTWTVLLNEDLLKKCLDACNKPVYEFVWIYEITLDKNENIDVSELESSLNKFLPVPFICQNLENNRISLQISSTDADIKREIKNILTSHIKLKLEGSTRVNKGKFIPHQEMMILEEAKDKGSEALSNYKAKIAKQGYAWLPEEYKENLLWMDDPYDISSRDFKKVTHDCFSGYIYIELTEDGAKKMSSLSKTYTKEKLAIVYQNRIVAMPTIEEHIPDGRAALLGFSTKEAMRLESILRYSLSKYIFTLVEEKMLK